MNSDLAARLGRRLTDLWHTETGIHQLRQLSGGASRETWAFVAHPAGGPQRRLVLRRDPPGHGRPDRMGWEAASLRAAAAEDVPVPGLVDHGTDETVLGSPYVLTGYVDGETIPRRLLREPQFETVRGTLAAELGRVAARIHRIPVSAVPGLQAPDPLEDLISDYDRLGEPLPSVEIALHWLRRHRPEPVPETVVHGDLRNGNLIVHPDGLRAVLDWEKVHRGDPREDLGWLCVKAWRFGSALPVGGFGTREQLLAGYAEVAGVAPDPDAVRWWEVYGTTWWAVGCRWQAQRHLGGETRSVELAAIGRRVCEQEHDLLSALGIAADEKTDAAEAPASDLHGHPTASELLVAVGEYLRDEVLPRTDGRLSFHARVAANVVDTVERELRLGGDQERRHRDRLAALGFSTQAELAAALRAGTVNPDDPAVLAVVRAAVTDRLLVANPGYLHHPG